jgi:hypothetical protein
VWGGAGLMPAPEPRVSVARIRREAQLACEAASLRSVAADVGLTPMGLRRFIRGESTPQPRTVRKLTLWYARRMGAQEPEGEQATRAALTVFLALYPPADRPRVERLFLRLMEEQFHESGIAPPAWLQVLWSDVGDGPD